MRKSYDFANMKGKRNPYARELKQAITIRLDRQTISYFKGLASEMDVPYQTLINLYLRDCAVNGKKPRIKWAS